MKPRFRYSPWSAAIIFAALGVIAARIRGEDDQISFVKQIAPIFVGKCQTCHNAEKAKGGYRLENFETLMKAGESKERPIVPGNSSQSKLYQLITAADPDDRMPQKADPLPAGQIALIEKWIAQGAKFDGTNRTTPFSVFAASAVRVSTPAQYPQPVPILALAFHPRKAELAAGGYGEVTFWNPTNGMLLHRIGQMPQKIQALDFTRDGETLVLGGGSPGISGEALAVRNSSNRVVLGLSGDMILDVKIAPDDQRVATAGADNSIRVYDLANGKQRLVIQQHADWVTAIAWSHDGKRIASASRDRTCRVFDAGTGELEATYMGHEAPVLSVAFGRDDKFVYSGGRDKKIHVWLANEGKKTNELTGAEADILRLISDGNRLFACSADKQVREYDLSEGKLRRTYSGHADWVYSLAIDSTHERLASGAFDGEVRVWDLESGELISHFVAAPGLSVRQAQR